MEVRRLNPHLNEFIDMMDRVYLEAGGSVSVAWERLGKTEKDFMRGEIRHCMQDPRYYLENYHVIRTEQDGLTTLSPFWDSQELFYNEVWNLHLAGKKVMVMVLKARQLGISTICEGLVFWKTLMTPVCNTLIVATDTAKADHQFEMSRVAYDSLPWWMRPEVRYDQKGRILVFDRKDDMTRKVHPGLKSAIYVEAANKTTGVARGRTIRAAHLSELATWEGGGETLTQQIFPSMNASDTMAFMESTAEGRSGFWYRFWKRTEEGKTKWHPIFIPFYKVRKYRTPIDPKVGFEPTKEEEQFRHAILEDTGYQITDEILNWRRLTIDEEKAATGDEFGFMQEYPVNSMEAFQGKGVCAFNKRLLYKRLEIAPTPHYIGEIDLERDTNEPKLRIRPVMPGEQISQPEFENRFMVWETPSHDDVYYIGADVAQGVVGGDYSVVEVIKIGAGMAPDEQVAEWRGLINPTDFAYVICAIAYWYNSAEVSVEVNNVGKVTNNEIFQNIQYENVYRWRHMDKVRNALSNYFGWETNYKTREALIAKMNQALNENTLDIRSKFLLDEMTDFSYDDDGEGKAQGRESKDDRVMAMMICRYCAHDSDIGKTAMARPMQGTAAGGEKWYLVDPEGRMVEEFDDRQSAQAAFEKTKIVAKVDQSMFRQKYDPNAKPKAGYSIIQGAKAKTFANSLYSPIHNANGIRSRMFYEMGYSAENIDHESILYEQAAETPNMSDPNAWMSI